MQSFVEEFKSKKYPIHGLINNAGIFLTPHAKTDDGFEVRGGGMWLVRTHTALS